MKLLFFKIKDLLHEMLYAVIVKYFNFTNLIFIFLLSVLWNFLVQINSQLAEGFTTQSWWLLNCWEPLVYNAIIT
jgi:hypothetical protein